MKHDSNRRFHVEQDRAYSAELINENQKWSNTKVNLIQMWTVYEFVGSPSYQTPVFHGTELQCLDWIKNQ